MINRTETREEEWQYASNKFQQPRGVTMKAQMTLSGLLIKKKHLDFSVWNLVCESEEQFMIHYSCLIFVWPARFYSQTHFSWGFKTQSEIFSSGNKTGSRAGYHITASRTFVQKKLKNNLIPTWNLKHFLLCVFRLCPCVITVTSAPRTEV